MYIPFKKGAHLVDRPDLQETHFADGGRSPLNHGNQTILRIVIKKDFELISHLTYKDESSLPVVIVFVSRMKLLD